MNKLVEFNLDIRELLELIKERCKERIILFGASTFGKKMFGLLQEYDIDVDFFCDNDANKWNTLLYDKKIISPKELVQTKEKCFVIITSMYYMDIYNTLKTNDMLYCVTVKKYVKSKYEDEFENDNKANPSSSVYKQIIVREYIKEAKAKVFFETGTFLGAMVDAVEDLVNNVYSIEIDNKLYKRNLKKYCGNTKISLFNGDSGELISDIINKVDESIVFWLDGHYSGGYTSKGHKETPILKELSAILNHKVKNHLILIDDANCFNGNYDYPTLSEVEKFIKRSRKNSLFKVEDNIIRIQLQ